MSELHDMRRPKSLMTPTEFLSREECKALFDKMMGMIRDGGDLEVSLVSRWIGSASWARNRMKVAADMRTTDLWLRRRIRGSVSSVRTARLDETGLRDALRIAESSLRVDFETPEQYTDPYIEQPIVQPTLFSDATYRHPAAARTETVQHMIEPAEAAGLLSAGTFKMMADSTATIMSNGMFRYYSTTAVECSTTVRDTKGTASGWAGVNHYDLAKIDPQALAARALDKAQRSANPQAVEPGRYTVILEPQAVADLFSLMLGMPLDRMQAEGGATPFSARRRGWTKISEQVMDRRLIMRADPMDPDGGFIPYERYSGTPYRPVSWIDRGILQELSYNRYYALNALGSSEALLDSGSFRLAAPSDVPTTSVDAMIAKTERGILITRLYGVELVDMPSLLCTGYTRDGVWLIEHGKITRPVKNFRFTESPLFVLNKLLDIGPSVRVFKPGSAWLAPAVRVSDFSLTGLADAV